MVDDDFFATVGTQVAQHGRKPTETLEQSVAPHVAEEKNTPFFGGSAWAGNNDHFWGTAQSYKSLPCGVYRMNRSDTVGPIFVKQRNDTDKLVHFMDSESHRIIEEIKMFHSLRQEFSRRGFLHKRGVLLWGPPGSGKTTTVQFLIELVVKEHGGIAVLVDNPHIAGHCLASLRRIEPDRVIIGILEDLDALVAAFGEPEFLSLLDGEAQINGIVYVATTNYPERLDKRFVDRPSRFDTVRYIGMPSYDARAAYLRAKEPEWESYEIARFAEMTDGLSVAHLREFIILVQCFKWDPGEAVARLSKFKFDVPSSERAPDRPSFGFAKPVGSVSV